MNNVSAQFQAPWNGFGQLDPHHRSMLNLPDSALHGNMADLLAEASYRMSAVSPSLGQQLNSSAAQEDLPPLDFADFPISQPAEQHYTCIFPIMDGQLLPQPQTSLPEFPPKNSQLLQPHTTSQALDHSSLSPEVSALTAILSCMKEPLEKTLILPLLPGPGSCTGPRTARPS